MAYPRGQHSLGATLPLQAELPYSYPILTLMLRNLAYPRGPRPSEPGYPIVTLHLLESRRKSSRLLQTVRDGPKALPL